MLTSGSLIQSTFGVPGNFEVVLTRPLPSGSGEVQHYWRENDRPDKPWRRGSIITYGATGPACIVQTHDSSLHVVAAMQNALVHFRMDPASLKWNWVATFAFGATGAAGLCQNRENQNLEAVALHGRLLIHHWFDQASWHADAIITDHATGAPALIQNRNRNLEVLVPEANKLVLYFRDEQDPQRRWKPGGVVSQQATNPGSFVQAVYGPPDNPNFEAVVPEGDQLRHYWRDHSQNGLPWIPGTVITSRRGPVHAASIATTNVKGNNLDVLVEEGNSVFHYYRTEEMRWYRGTCLRISEGPTSSAGTSEKVRQLTGQADFPTKQPIHDAKMHLIKGTDLGAAFEHRGRHYFLFGDTHWEDGRCGHTRDVIAVDTDSEAANSLRLRFHRSCTEVMGGDVTMNEYDVPLDGFSHRDEMYVFFTSDHFKDRRVMYRSLLARCVNNDPGREIDDSYLLPLAFIPTKLKFQYLSDLSTDAFINVSVALAGPEEIRRSELPADDRALIIWGSGAYRADAVVLACLPLTDAAPNLDQIHYFTGAPQGHPQWSPPGRQNEWTAVPLFYPAAIGELSVRWDPVLHRWVLLYCTGPEDPAGACVTLRVSRAPWGPWSARRIVLDWIRDGLKRFIHQADFPDGLNQDDTPYPRDASEGGGAYAPYHLPQYTTAEHDVITLYYLLSTWNPYQAVLMRHTLTRADLNHLDGLTGPPGAVPWITKTDD
jgi:hypothetical protein